jgi:hypothetical protein
MRRSAIEMKNNSSSDVARAIRRTLADYLDDAPSANTLSARDAILHLRKTMPELRCSDLRLTDLVAGAVIIAGLDVGFDRSRRRAAYGTPDSFAETGCRSSA